MFMGLADASEMAYGPCVQLWSVDHQGEVKGHVLCLRCRVAPVKKVTLPRLELCIVVLLAEMIDKILPVLILELNSYNSLVMNFFTCYEMEYIHDQLTGMYSRDY